MQFRIILCHTYKFVFTGDWKDDRPHGIGEYIWGDGGSKSLTKQTCNIYRGMWVEGKRQGQGTSLFSLITYISVATRCKTFGLSHVQLLYFIYHAHLL